MEFPYVSFAQSFSDIHLIALIAIAFMLPETTIDYGDTTPAVYPKNSSTTSNCFFY